MTLRSVLLDDEAILYIDGAFDDTVAPIYHTTVEHAFTNGARTVVMDLTRTTAIDGGGIAALAATAAACKARNGQLIIATPDGVQTAISDPAQVRVLLRGVDPWREAG
ncbi:MAG TPA: STAS domain-containing protein [Pseudonocardiaceae bacterium]|jgi:anti-anti-sigma regulatory factor|nr:STAS domain-containing protein [Pseudonocardiaceae bacterium]